jgi:hypothetical protein
LIASIAKRVRRQWSELIRRAFGQRAVIAKILGHLGLPSAPPPPAKARASPWFQAQLDHVA